MVGAVILRLRGLPCAALHWVFMTDCHVLGRRGVWFLQLSRNSVGVYREVCVDVNAFVEVAECLFCFSLCYLFDAETRV